MKSIRLVVFLIFAFLAAPAEKAHAASCSVSESAISFGSIDVLDNSNSDITGTLTVSCSNVNVGDTVYHCISIGAGSPTGDATSRQMSGPGAANLRFDLFSDSGRTTLWGSWVTGYDSPGVQIVTPSGNSTNSTVYARVFPGQQTVPAGSYSTTFATDPTDQWVDNPGPGSCPAFPGLSTSNGSFTVTATVLASCKLNATNLNFGSRGILSSNTDSTSTITIQCTNGTPYNVGLDQGTAPGATVASRQMVHGPDGISYSLFSNSTRTTNWGNTIGSDTLSGVGTGLSQSLTVYGRVPAQQTPAPATYSDTIVVTVTY